MRAKHKTVGSPLALRIHAAKIAQKMKDSKLPEPFILSVFNLVAQDHRSAYELMVLWEEAEADKAEQNEAAADLQELLDDLEIQVSSPARKPYVRFEELETIAKGILAYKAKLRSIIEKNGGVTRVAELSGIPQPSLSRMLSSATMPRKTTLYRIAQALGLSEKDIATDFVW